MFVPFNDMHFESRLWIYQSFRKLTQSEVEAISHLLTEFCSTWAAHGQQLKTSFDIRHNQFIILAADESHHGASGCSIDDSVRIIKRIDEQFNLNLFERNLIAFLMNDEVVLLPLTELKEKSRTGTWKATSLTFNNLVSTKGQLDTAWLVPAGNSWLKRYLASEAITT
jgi:hypothetical protein